MNRAWYIYFGHKMNLGREETLLMRYGEMQDMLTCMAIENGGAEQIIKKRKSFSQVMEME